MGVRVGGWLFGFRTARVFATAQAAEEYAGGGAETGEEDVADESAGRGAEEGVAVFVFVAVGVGVGEVAAAMIATSMSAVPMARRVVAVGIRI
jgi:nucleoside phosphorylase